MRKKILSLGLVATMCLAMTACGKEDNSKKTTATTKEEVSEITTTLDVEDDNTDIDADKNEVTGDGDIKSDVDIESMSYEEVEAYLDTLPETGADMFEITTDDMPEGEAAITYYSGTSSVVVIPEEIDGLKITKLNKWSFTNNETVKAVKICKNLNTVGDSVFVNASVIYITGAENVETIMTGAFCARTLKSIRFSEKAIYNEDLLIFSTSGDVTVFAPKDSNMASTIKKFHERGMDSSIILEEY